MPPKGIGKAVSKRCPECKKQLPVATRHCACGHQFFEDRRRSSSTALTPPQDGGPDIEEISPIRIIHSGGNGGAGASVLLPVSHPTVFPLLLTKATVWPVTAGAVGGTGGCAAANTPEGGKRRSERVKREKPNFYDALEYDNKMRKARRERQKTNHRNTRLLQANYDPYPCVGQARRERQKDEPQQHTTASGRAKRERRAKNSSPDEEEDEEPVVKEKKRRKKKKKVKKEEEEEEEDIMAGISPYREMSFSYVLADINLKLGLNNPKFT